MSERFLSAVDDERRIRLGLEQKLQSRYGCLATICVFATAEGCLEYAMGFGAPHVVVTDVRLPGMNGIELSSRLLSAGRRIEVIMLSGFDDYEYVRSALTLGAVDYVLKPVADDELFRAIDLAFDRLGVSLSLNGLGSDANVTREALVQCVDDHVFEPVGVQEIADMLRITPSHASARFRQLTGTTITAYVRRRRIDQARRLLQTPTLSVKEISAMLGYRFPHHFAREFRRLTGKSPSEFRSGR